MIQKDRAATRLFSCVFQVPLPSTNFLLSLKAPIIRGDDLLFPKPVIPKVDMAHLVYFALSIFWRGTRRWSAVEEGRPPELDLGGQEEAIRLFLLGRRKLLEMSSLR
jgi:hypothetical protein